MSEILSAEEEILPLIVGESPSRTGDRYWRWPLSGAPARTLCQCAGWPPDGPPSELRSWSWALYERCQTVNVFDRYAQATPWRAEAARANACEILDRVVRYQVPAVVLLGRRVGAAFGLAGVPFFEWRELLCGAAVVIPHPSGRNLLLNEPRTREEIGATLRAAVGVREMTPPPSRHARHLSLYCVARAREDPEPPTPRRVKMTAQTTTLTGDFQGREITIEAKIVGDALAVSGPVFLAKTPSGSKTYAVNGYFDAVDASRRPVVRRGERGIFRDAAGREFRLGQQVVVRNRHAYLVGLVADFDPTTVLPYFQADR